MSENLIHDVMPHMAPPVTRERIRSASEASDGATLAIITVGPVTIAFADDDAE
jgi:hypothetical protein